MTSGTPVSGSTPVKALEIIKGRLHFLSIQGNLKDTSTHHFFTTDQSLTYEPFFSDFGPLNLGQLYRFCKILNGKLKNPKYKGKQLVYYSSTRAQNRANSAVLIGAFMVMYHNQTPEQAYAPLRAYEPYIPFRDASMGMCSYKLTVKHSIQGIYKAHKFKLFDFPSFNVDEYEYFECVENGDLNTIVPNKYIAFAGPHSTKQGPDGYPQLTPEDYFPIWKKYDVKTIVRLNRKMYDKTKFERAGFQHYDLFFIDGTTPSKAILDSFLALSEREEGMIAVHCKAGLGRTGTLMGCYIMKHMKFTAEETIAWLRVCRPGSVIGPQQQYLVLHQQQMWDEGERWRQERGLSLAWEEPTAAEEESKQQKKQTSTQGHDTPTKAKSLPTPQASPSGKQGSAAYEPKSPTTKQKMDRDQQKKTSKIGDENANSNRAKVKLQF